MDIRERARFFEWDGGNGDKIRARHKVEPSECEEVFFNPFFTSADEAHSQFEWRLRGLGATNSGRALFIAFTVRGERIRVISARDMSRKERKFYEKKIEENSEV